MKQKIVLKFCIFILVTIFTSSLFAQDSQNENLVDNGNFIIGAGLAFQYFSQEDDFRKASGLFGDSDKIEGVTGAQLYGELLLNDTFALELPVGVGIGYKFQMMAGGVEYTTTLSNTIEKKIEITNHIAYMNLYIPLDADKYWVLGGTAGVGYSGYEISWTYSSSAYTDTSDTASGFVIPLGVFLDWGADGIGGRLGYNYVLSKYSDIDGSTPKGGGSQFYIDLRYAF